MSESAATPEAIAARIAELTRLANALGYDAIMERHVPTSLQSVVYDLIRDGRIVTTSSSLDELQRYLNMSQ